MLPEELFFLWSTLHNLLNIFLIYTSWFIEEIIYPNSTGEKVENQPWQHKIANHLLKNRLYFIMTAIFTDSLVHQLTRAQLFPKQLEDLLKCLQGLHNIISLDRLFFSYWAVQICFCMYKLFQIL